MRKIFPTWVPEEYEELVPPQAGTFVRAQYENRGGELLTFCYVAGAQKTSLNVEWEGAVVRRCSVGGLPADLYLNPEDGPNILVWTDYGRDAAFWITAPLSGEELVQVAESVRESDSMPRRYCVSLLPVNYGAYSVASETEGDGRGEIVYENDQGFFVTFGYSDDAASVPCPGGTADPVRVGNREGALYPASEADGNKTLLWTTQDGDVLWVCGPLPDEDLLLIAENVIVRLNQFTDLMEIQGFDVEAPLLEAVERALTEAYTAQVEACARRDAQTGNYMSEEYNRLWRDQQAWYISPERDEAMARIAALADAFGQEGRYGESIVSLFGPFYTASVRVSDYDYSLFFKDGMPEGYFDTTAHVVDERGVLIAGYHSGGLPKLKSGLTSGKLSAAGGASVSRSVIQSAVSKLIQSDVSDVSDKVSSGMTKEYVEKLEAQAKEDAQAGVYGKNGKASQLREEQMKKYVSPDRDGAIAQVSKLLMTDSLGTAGKNTVSLYGLPYTASVSRGLSGVTVEIFDEDGETIASYDSGSGQWKSVATKTELQFQTASSAAYDEAYRAEKARLSGAGSGTSPSLDTRT